MIKASSAVGLQLNLRLQSVGDQRKFVPLVIDDYRYDEPNHFQDKRVPNVVFEVTSADGKPVPFGASSQGRGLSSEVIHVAATLHLGIDVEAIDREMQNVVADARGKPPAPADAQAIREEAMNAARKLVEIQAKLNTSRPGTYRVRAHYRPKVAGKWIGEVSTKPITIKVVENK